MTSTNSLSENQGHDMRVGNLPGIRRLPLYLNIVRKFRKAGTEHTSASAIAAQAGLVPSVVRKDLEMTGAVGTTGLGFPVRQLIIDIEAFLGWDNPFDAFLVGAGRLGTTILGCGEFRSQGLNIVAAFDVDIDKIGRRVHGVEILPVEKIRSLAERMHIGIGVLTVPAVAAQEMAGLLADAGILRIWNFTAEVLDVPPEVTVQREDLSAGLAELLVRSAR